MTHDSMMTRIMAIAEQVGLEPTQAQIAEHDAIIDQYCEEQMALAGSRDVSTRWDAQMQEYRCTAGSQVWYHPMYWCGCDG